MSSGGESYGPAPTSNFAYREMTAIGVLDDEQVESQIPDLFELLLEEYLKGDPDPKGGDYLKSFKEFAISWLKARRIKACQTQATQVTLVFDDGRQVNLIPRSQPTRSRPKVIPIV